MTGYEYSRIWWDFCFECSEVRPNHSALYFFILEHHNRLGRKKEFGLPTTMAKEAIKIKSYNTYIETLNDLVAWGFVEMIERSKNQYSSNVVALLKNDKALDKALDKASIKHVTKHKVKQRESTGQSNSSIDKQVNNQTNQTNKPINQETSKQDSEKNLLGRTIEKVEVIEKPLTIKKEKIKPHPFADSKIYDLEKFKAAFAGSKYETCNLDFYHEAVSIWRNKDGTEPERSDWKRVATKFMLNDYQDGKLVMQNHKQKNVKQSTNYNNKSGASTSIADNILREMGLAS